MRHVIAGTAGHVDHGKTSLVRALTGIDTDRLPEEKRRGISIELGFAHLDLTRDLRIGFVDVPGHERFVKNMLAGVGGIDFVLFVIAADECIKPQTVEHFEICRMLGVGAGVVAITKCDLGSADDIELAQLEVDSFLAGSFLEKAPVIPVSVATGQGLDQLRSAIESVARSVPQRAARDFARLPIDRAFSVKGYGTVVTGTLLSGVLALNEELELYPAGKRVRLRSLQVHSHAVERAYAGERTAATLAGVEVTDVRRGAVLSAPGAFVATREVDCMVEILRSSPPLKHRAPVHFHSGTAETEARVLMTSPGLMPVEPGCQAPVRLVLAEPQLLLPGDRFIIRRFSPVETIGGGTVVDAMPPRRLRRGEREARIRLLASLLASGTGVERVAFLVRESQNGLGIEELTARTGLAAQSMRDLARKTSLLLLHGHREWLADRTWVDKVARRLKEALAAFHRENPLQRGMRKEALRTAAIPQAPPFLLDILLHEAPDIVAEGELLRLKTHSVALLEEEQSALGRIEAAFREAGFGVPDEKEAVNTSGVNPERGRQLLQMLLRDRRLVRVAPELILHQKALDRLREILKERRGQRFSVADFKEWTSVSRKYAIPLLEFLDRQRMTRREGESRIVV